MFKPKAAHDFVGNYAGSIAPVVAVGAVVLLGAAGVALDSSRLVNNQTGLQAAADATALTAVATAVEKRSAGQSISAAKTSGQNHALQFWLAETTNLGDTATASPVITLTESTGTWTAKVDYAATMQASISTVIGFGNLELEGTATATSGAQSSTVNTTDYYDFTFLADISASMGIGATQPIRQAMIANPNIACDFACHITYSGSGNNPYLATRAAGHTLRIDKVDDAIDDAIDMLSDQPSPSRFRAALYGMDHQLVTYQALTSNLAAVKSETVDIRPVTGGQGYTWGKHVLNLVKPKIGTSGDGSSQAQAKKVLVLISDGVENYSHPVSGYANTAGYSHWTNGISLERCDQIKANGVTIVTLQIDFIQEYGPANYANIVQPIEHLIEPNMQSCASSPALYRSVDDASGIAQALDDLVGAVFTTSSTDVARLSK